MAILVNEDGTVTVTGLEAQSIVDELAQTITQATVTQVVPANTVEQIITQDGPEVSQVDVDGVEIIVQTVADSVIKEMYLVDHGILDGLADDDHPQYLNNTRGDIRYTPLTHITGPDTNPHGLQAVNLPGISSWGTRVTPADLNFINTNMAENAIPSTRIASLVAGKIAAGLMTARVVLGDLFSASRWGSVLNDDQSSLANTDQRIQMGFVNDFDTLGAPVTYMLRHCNGYAGNHPSHVSNFSVDANGNVKIRGDVDIQGGIGISNLSDAGALATRDTTSFFSATEPANPITGDIWYQLNNNNTPVRFNGATWDSVKDSDIAIAQGAADAKVQAYYQDTEPTGLTAADNGDIWFDTGNGNRAAYYSHPAWLDAQDSDIAMGIALAATAQSTADGKVTTYTGAEPAVVESVGDLWHDAPNHLLKRTTTAPVPTWDVISNSFDDTNLLADSANLGGTANWSGVTDDGGRPQDNADVTDVGGVNFVIRGLASPNTYSGANVSDLVAGVSNWGITLGDSSGVTQIVTFGLPGLGVGVNYTLSFWAYTDIVGSTATVDLYPESLPGFTLEVTSVAPEYFTFSINSADPSMSSAILRMFKTTTDVNPTSNITIFDIKFERGTQATDWSPYNPSADQADSTPDTLIEGVNITGGGITLNDNGVIGAAIKTRYKTSYNSGAAGLFLGWDTIEADYVFSLGDDTNFIKWDGTTLTIQGGITVDYANIIGIKPPATATDNSSWAHSSDPTRIDGESIYTNSITADRFITELEGDLNQALHFTKTILSAGDEYVNTLVQADFTAGTLSNLDAISHVDYGLSIRLDTVDHWDSGNWDSGFWDVPVQLSGYFESASQDTGSTKTIQMSFESSVFEDNPASTSVVVEMQYSLDNINWGSNENVFNDNIWENCTETTIGGKSRWSGHLHTFRYFKQRITITTSNNMHRIILFNARFIGNVVNVYGFFENQTIAAGGTTFTISGYTSTPAITVTSTSGPRKIAVSGKSSTGFTAHLYDSSDTDIGGSADIIIMGA